jgi:hypothetical protein
MDDLETIRMNNDAELQFKQLSSGQSIAIVDNFLADPGKLKAFAKRHADEFAMPPCYITQSNEIAELVDEVPAKYNRLLFYSGDMPRSAQISSPQLLSTDLGKGRLTLNCFASVRPR